MVKRKLRRSNFLWSINILLSLLLVTGCTSSSMDDDSISGLNGKSDQGLNGKSDQGFNETSDQGFNGKSDQSSKQSDQTINNDAANPAVTKVPMYLIPYGMFLRITINGVGPLLLRYDTGVGGAQILMDPTEAKKLGFTEGYVNAKLEGGFEINQRTLVFMEWGDAQVKYPDFPNETVVGAVGNGFFEGLAVGLNFRDKELWLVTSSPNESIALPAPNRTGEPEVVPIELPGDYISMPCSFAHNTASQTCLFDTGAITSLVFTSYWNTLSHPSKRIVPTVSVDIFGNSVLGYFQRAETVTFGGTGEMASVPGDYISVANFDWFASWCKENLSPACVGILGLETIIHFYAILDLPNHRLLLYPYEDFKEDLFPTPFLGFGFIIGSFEPTSVGVEAVVPNSFAEAAGVAQGDRLIAIDNIPVYETHAYVATPSLIIFETPGKTRLFTFLRGAEEIRLNITSEDLLPPIN